MLKMWKNMKLSTKIVLILGLMVFALLAGWFSGVIPTLILDHYRTEYAEMPKDPATGFPSLKDRTESSGMGTFMTIAYWCEMSQDRKKAREIYTEALYRYGWDHPRGPELWTQMMDMRFGGSNADPIEDDAITFYWLYATKYNDKYALPSASFTPHPAFATYEPIVAKMVARRGSRVLIPIPSNDFDLDNEVLLRHKDRGAAMMLRDFVDLNSIQKINPIDLKAVGEESSGSYIPLGSKVDEFSIKDWD